MRLEDFNRQEITWEESDLLPDGVDIWVSECTNQWVTDHNGTLVLSVVEEIFIEDDNEWRVLPMQQFILTSKN
jgi:hypothetical protein